MSEELKALVRAYQRIVETYQQFVAALNPRASELEVQKEALSRQYQVQTERLAGVAHEVRISLTALKGDLYILLHEEPTDPETRRILLAEAYQNAERVIDLMSNQLNLAG